VAMTVLLGSLLGLAACSEKETEQHSTSPAGRQAVPANTDKTTDPVSDQPDTEPLSREEKIKQLEAMIPPEIPKVPETVEDFAALPPGPYAGLSYSDHPREEKLWEILRTIPDIENPDEEVIHLYYRALLGLVAEDFPDPQEIINQIKMSSFGSPEIDDPRYQFKEQYNVEIILDSSGSMAEREGNQTRMEAAKAAIKEFAKSLPEQANVALRVYGHRGSGSDTDKALSCGSSELVYGMAPYNQTKLDQALSKFKPAGWTPIAYSLQESAKDFQQYSGEKNTNIIYLVSDGIETCGGNPAEAAKRLAESDIAPIVNVIGFGVDGEGQRQLKEVAEAAGGRYVLIQNQKELEEEFEATKEMAEKWWRWKFDSSREASHREIVNSLDIGMFSHEWEGSSHYTQYNILIAADEMRDVVSDETIDELKRFAKEQNEYTDQLITQLRRDLESLNKKTYKEAIEMINQTYNQKVPGHLQND